MLFQINPFLSRCFTILLIILSESMDCIHYYDTGCIPVNILRLHLWVSNCPVTTTLLIIFYRSLVLTSHRALAPSLVIHRNMSLVIYCSLYSTLLLLLSSIIWWMHFMQWVLVSLCLTPTPIPLLLFRHLPWLYYENLRQVYYYHLQGNRLWEFWSFKTEFIRWALHLY